MTKHLLFILSIILYTKYCCAMETGKQEKQNVTLTNKKSKKPTKITITNNNVATKNNQSFLTKIDNGLLTTVPGKIACITFDGGSGDILSTKISIYRTTLKILITYEEILPLQKDCPIIETFSPIVLKESLNNICNMPFVDLGLFNRNKHKEALEAIKQNKALYCSCYQGAIIYNTEKQPDPHNYQEINNYIKIDPRLKLQKLSF